MTAPVDAALRQLAVTAVANRAGAAPGVVAIAEATRRAYDDLARVAAPLIGQVGVDALMGRTLYLAQRQYQWLTRASEPDQWSGPFAKLVFCLEEQDSVVALDAAGTVLAMLTGLLATLVGNVLTFRVLQEAWPDAYTEAKMGER